MLTCKKPEDTIKEKTKTSPLILLHFPVIYVLEVIYIYCIWMVELLWNGVLLPIWSQVHVQRSRISNLRSATVEVLTPQNWQMLQVRIFLPRKSLLKIYQHTTCYGLNFASLKI